MLDVHEMLYRLLLYSLDTHLIRKGLLHQYLRFQHTFAGNASTGKLSVTIIIIYSSSDDIQPSTLLSG